MIRTAFSVFHVLFLFVAIAAGTAFCVAAASIANVDFTQSAVIACTVVLAIGYAAADCGVDFLIFFVHHIKKPPSKVKAVYANSVKIIDILKNFL